MTASGQLERHGRPPPDVAGDPHASPLQVDEAPHAGQSEPRASVLLSQSAADELVEDGVEVLGGNASSLVRYRDPDHGVGLLEADRDG